MPTSTPLDRDRSILTTCELLQNYPNPFNPTTEIQFTISERGNYSLKVFNILGQEIAALIDGDLTAGVHRIKFDGRRLSSGVYLYKRSSKNVSFSKKMLLMK